MEDIQTQHVQKAEVANARPLNRWEVLKGLQISIWEGAAATVWITLTGGAFLTGFALWLHANSFAIGLLSAIPTLAALTQPIAAYWAEQKSARKPFVAWCSFCGRMLWLPILLLPFFLPKSLALLGFLLLFTISAVLTSMPQPVWTSWMSDLVPPDHRGRYFGRRNMVAGFVGMVVGMLAAWFLDYMVHGKRHPAMGFAVVFGVSLLGAVLSLILILRQPEPSPSSVMTQGEEPRQGFLEHYRAPFADPNFRALLLFSAVFCIGQFVAAPFFTAYGLQILHLNYVWMQILAALVGVSNMLGMPLWGFLADRFGNKPILILNVVGVFTLPFFWIPTSPQHLLSSLILLLLNSLGSGLFWAGVGLTQFNLIIACSPPQRTATYAATLSAVTGLIGGIAPMVGGILLQMLAGIHLSLFGLTIINYHLLFALAAVMRLAALPFLRPLEDRGAVSATKVLQDLGRSGLRQWRYIRTLQRAAEEEARRRAAEGLTEKGSYLAIEELGKALSDPSRAVRAEAARALGETADTSAVDLLLKALEDVGTDIIGEIAQALGKLGDRRANPALIAMLESPKEAFSESDRLALVRALGKLGGADAVEALIRLFSTVENGQSPEALALALGETGAAQAVQPLGERLQQLPVGHPLRRAIVRALGDIGERSALPFLRSLLEQADTEPSLVPILADALVRLGDAESAFALAARLARLPSPVARRQVAHAVGRLLNVGDCVYGLLSQAEREGEAVLLKAASELPRNFPIADVEAALLHNDHATALNLLLTRPRPPSKARGKSERRVLLAFLEKAHTLPPTAELVTIVLCALRALYGKGVER